MSINHGKQFLDLIVQWAVDVVWKIIFLLFRLTNQYFPSKG